MSSGTRASKTFPEAWRWQALVESMETSFFPLPLPPRPCGSTSYSRGRQRLASKREVWREASQFVTMLNSLDKGRVGSTTERRKTAGRQLAADPMTSLAQQQALDVALREAARLVRARRGLGLTGAQAVGRLLLGCVRMPLRTKGSPCRIESERDRRAEGHQDGAYAGLPPSRRGGLLFP